MRGIWGREETGGFCHLSNVHSNVQSCAEIEPSVAHVTKYTRMRTTSDHTTAHAQYRSCYRSAFGHRLPLLSPVVVPTRKPPNAPPSWRIAVALDDDPRVVVDATVHASALPRMPAVVGRR